MVFGTNCSFTTKKVKLTPSKELPVKRLSWEPEANPEVKANLFLCISCAFRLWRVNFLRIVLHDCLYIYNWAWTQNQRLVGVVRSNHNIWVPVGANKWITLLMITITYFIKVITESKVIVHADNWNTNPFLSISTPPDIEAPNEARGRADKRSDAAIRWECGVRIPLAVPR